MAAESWEDSVIAVGIEVPIGTKAKPDSFVVRAAKVVLRVERARMRTGLRKCIVGLLIV